MNKQVHLVPDSSNNRWLVKIAGAKQGKIFRTKKEAGRYAIKRADRDNLIRVIHDRLGRFCSKKSY